jgi:phage terminase large subunit-like protein
MVVRAVPQSVTPPSSPFTVPNEQHEAQRNIVILTTTKVQMDMSDGGAGTRDDPRGRDKETGLWWQRFDTVGAGKRGRRFVVWAFDPTPDDLIVDAVLRSLGRRKFGGFSERPPEAVSIEPMKETLDPRKLAKSDFGRQAGLGRGLFRSNRLLAAGALVLGPRKLSNVVLRFDHSALEPRTAVVLHGAQWSEDGTAEGGITLVALAPETRKR